MKFISYTVYLIYVGIICIILTNTPERLHNLIKSVVLISLLPSFIFFTPLLFQIKVDEYEHAVLIKAFIAFIFVMFCASCIFEVGLYAMTILEYLQTLLA